MNELCMKLAREVVSLLRKKENTRLDLIKITEERIAEVDGMVNTLPTLCLDRAREHARRIMQQWSTDPPAHYLYGLPTVVKDIVDMEGVKSTHRSLAVKDHIPDCSDIMVQVLEENGAVVIGRSNTPEFAAGGNTFNEVFGATLNPWDTNRTCGGPPGGPQR
jgi:amidase